MEYKPLVSIIIPTYNTEKYVDKMLQCVCKQTYSNVEIIVVDDGSTDNTLKQVKSVLCDTCFKTQIIQIPHRGVSAARNAGMECAKGEKIFFWDSDDSMEPNTISDCVEFSNVHEVNAVLYGYTIKINGTKGSPHVHELKQVYRNREIQRELMPHFLGLSFNDVNDWISGIKNLKQGKENSALWHIMLDAKTVRNNGLEFDTSLSLGEDTKFINEYLLYETSIGFMNQCLYYLTVRESGANISSSRDVNKRLSDKLKLINVRVGIDEKARLLYGIDTHPFWQGTLVVSVVEMALRLSKSNSQCKGKNIKMFRNFIHNENIRQAVKDFHPKIGIKSIPFFMIKYLGGLSLFCVFLIIPQKLLKRFAKGYF